MRPCEFLLPSDWTCLSPRYWEIPPAQEKPRPHHSQLSEVHSVACSHLCRAIKPQAAALTTTAFQSGGTARRARARKSCRSPSRRSGEVFLGCSPRVKHSRAKDHLQLRPPPLPPTPHFTGVWRGNRERMTFHANPPHGGGFLPAAPGGANSEGKYLSRSCSDEHFSYLLWLTEAPAVPAHTSSLEELLCKASEISLTHASFFLRQRKVQRPQANVTLFFGTEPVLTTGL